MYSGAYAHDFLSDDYERPHIGIGSDLIVPTVSQRRYRCCCILEADKKDNFAIGHVATHVLTTTA